jgi:hypothetical protein
MSDILKVNTRFGPKTVTVNRDHNVSIRIEGIPEWFTFTVDLETAPLCDMVFSNRTLGHFRGKTVRTFDGSEARFSHNGHVYAAGTPIAAFTKMAVGELS